MCFDIRFRLFPVYRVYDLRFHFRTVIRPSFRSALISSYLDRHSINEFFLSLLPREWLPSETEIYIADRRLLSKLLEYPRWKDQLSSEAHYRLRTLSLNEMTEQISWLDGESKIDGEIEKICPGRHIGEKQWRPEWNDMYLTPTNKHCYDYISDYECIFNHPINDVDQQRWKNLQDAKKRGTNVPIINIAHFTNGDGAEEIFKYRRFMGGTKKINEDAKLDVLTKLSWWSPIFTKEEKSKVRVHLGKVLQSFLGEEDDQAALQNQFATSEAFLPNPLRRENILFAYGIDDLCTNYGNLVGGDVQYKILGTFAYKQEIIHTVLVCGQADGDGQFAACPNVPTPEQDISNEAVITRDDDGNWVWKPQATATEIKLLHSNCNLQNVPVHRIWENVAFAFHILDEWKAGMTVGRDIIDHQKIINRRGEIVEFRKTC